MFKLKDKFSADYVQINIAGEEVHHAHIWLVPRSNEDNPGNFTILQLDKKDFELVLEKLNK